MKEKDTAERLTKFNLGLPIKGEEILGFYSWVNYNGFRAPETCGNNYQKIHQAYDFGVYLHQDGRKIVGLPEGVSVRATADGRVDVVRIENYLERLKNYQAVRIIHQSGRGTFYSWYLHVVPLVKKDEFIKKGQFIAEIFRGEFNTPHLHFELMLPEGRFGGRFIDPGLLFPELYRHNLDSI